MSIVEHEGQPWRENRPGSRLRVIADSGPTALGLALVHQICEPGVGAPSHTHDFDEIVTIVSGTAEVWIGSERQTVGGETSIFVPAGTVHGFRNNGNDPLQLLGVIAARELYGQYEDGSQPAQGSATSTGK